MGLIYKLYQHLAIESMEYFRDIGKEVDKERQRELTNKKYREARSMVDYNALDRHWENAMQDCWDNSPSCFGKNSPRHSE